jgi:alcohol dehydrogenase
MRTTWNFHAPHQLMFGAGAADTLGDACHRERWTNVVVITDRVLEKVGIVERVVRSLESAGCNVRVFADSCAEPAIEVAIAAADFAQQQPLSAIVGLGGGSNMDLAKIVAVLATHGGHPKDYFSFGRVPGPVLPIVCFANDSRNRQRSFACCGAHRCRKQDESQHAQPVPATTPGDC